MTNREKIIGNLKDSEAGTNLPDLKIFDFAFADPSRVFIESLTRIGGTVVEVESLAGVEEYLFQHYSGKRVFSSIKNFNTYNETFDDPRYFEDIDLTLLPGQFAVAENGSVWITDDLLASRVVPFICQHLGLIVDRKNIVSTMIDAYEKIGSAEYGFGVFIAGPSKTADIEQSLVLGAHGAKTMTLFLVGKI
jgi:L-lactate dehydrogenase complex protein LldG